jgi:hypothetical protein
VSTECSRAEYENRLAQRLAELLVAQYRRHELAKETATNTNARPSANQPGAGEHGADPCSIPSP